MEGTKTLKLGVVGKGGVGKTTVSALLARAYADRGARVVAIDTDSNPNLGVSLGLSMAEMEAVPVLPRSVLVGSNGAASAGALIEEYGRPTPTGATLLSAIRVNAAGAGCTCGGHATVRSLLGDALTDSADVTLVDMEAGLEHLSRSGGTLAHADVLLVVMEPSRKSVITAARTMALAEELGLDRVYGLGNKAASAADEDFFRSMSEEYGVPMAGVIPRDTELAEADRTGRAVGSVPPAVQAALDDVLSFLDRVSVPATFSRRPA